MEKLNYNEAREWFWVRTAIWFVPAALGCAMANFAFSADLIDSLSDRVWVSVASGVGTVLPAVLAAYLSMQMPWMRLGARISYVINGPFCGAVAALIAFILCGAILSFMQESPPNPVEHKAAYHAYLDMIDLTYNMMAFGCGASAFYGFIFGGWFAMRRDKYFVERIYD